MAVDDLPHKLTLVLKALSLSRAGLAHGLGVDKSLVGRWVSGKVTPSSHNLAALTRYVAERRPGFTLLDWEREVSAFARGLGVDLPSDAPAADDWFPPVIIEQSIHSVRSRGPSYDGFWRSTRPSHDLPGQFLHDISVIRSDREAGRIRFSTRIEGVTYAGAALLLQHQFFSISADSDGAALMFSIFNGVARNRAEMMDGITLATLRDAGGSPAAAGCVLERVADLPGDPALDEERLSALSAQTPLLAEPGSVPEAVRDHLTRSVSAGPEGFLRLLAATSMARGQMLTPMPKD
ncbi:MAG: helix-turn-helix transcriptional regulator [Pseudomonadota bacterium]